MPARVPKEAKEIRDKPNSISDTISNSSPKVSPSSVSKRLFLLKISIPAVCLVALTFFAAFASAEPAAEISARQSQAETVRNEINNLNIEMQINVEKYNQASTELDEILQRIEKNEALLEETLANLEASQERLEKRVVSIYRNGTVEVLDVLMATNDIKEFMSSFDLLAKIGEQDHSDLEQVKLFKAQVEETQAQLAEDQATQAALVDELESKKSQIEAGIAERERMMTGIEEEIAALEEEQRTRDLAAAQARLAAESVSYSGGGSSGGSSGGYAPAPAFSGGGDVVSIAMQYLGVPYVWGGASPSGFDCSGLTQYVYRQAGISLPRTAAAQQGAGTPIGYGQLAPGDLVFFGSPAYHVGIYIGGGSMIHAPYPGTVVSIAPLMGGFSGGVRV